MIQVVVGTTDEEVDDRVSVGHGARLADDAAAEAERSAPAGDPSRARATLGWEPEIGFEALIAEMVAADLAELRA